jgi:hypothetical protein
MKLKERVCVYIENMRAITELMIQENVVDSTSERNEGNGK